MTRSAALRAGALLLGVFASANAAPHPKQGSFAQLGVDGHRLAGLSEVEKDLQGDKAKDDSEVKRMETEIISLVHKRDAVKADDAHKAHEISFVHAEVVRIETKEHMKVDVAADESSDTTIQDDSAAATDQEETLSDAAEQTEAEVKTLVADSSAQSLRGRASAAESAAAADTQAASAASEARATAASAAASEARDQAKAVADARAEAAAAKAEAARIRASTKADAEAARVQAKADADSAAKEASDIKAARESAIAKAYAEAKATADAKLAAEAKVVADAKAVADAKVAAAAKAQEEADKERKQAEDARNKVADTADDSFKDFMKEEDGEDEKGDPEYEDSANALAGAIGWNRNAIESNADSAVKQLTEAIGGKKSIQAVQGMMSGIR